MESKNLKNHGKFCAYESSLQINDAFIDYNNLSLCVFNFSKMSFSLEVTSYQTLRNS